MVTHLAEPAELWGWLTLGFGLRLHTLVMFKPWHSTRSESFFQWGLDLRASPPAPPARQALERLYALRGLRGLRGFSKPSGA